jgi:uncharacterized protein (TIGR00251 family)
MSPFFQPTSRGFSLRLTVVPGSQRTQVVGLYGDRLKLRLAAPPEKGAANRELIDFLARAHKVVAVEDPSPDLGRRLAALAPDSQESA